MVEAAVELFGRQGYRATTLAQIAQQAGVSTETVQKHGPKSALLQAAIELASFGVEGETDFFATDLGKRMLQVRDSDELAAFTGDAMLAINAPSAGLWMTVAGVAHGDQELSVYHAYMLALIRGQVEHVLQLVAERGWLRPDVPFDELVEAFCIITCVETYVRFVQLDGRSNDAYRPSSRAHCARRSSLRECDGDMPRQRLEHNLQVGIGPHKVRARAGRDPPADAHVRRSGRSDAPRSSADPRALSA